MRHLVKYIFVLVGLNLFSYQIMAQDIHQYEGQLHQLFPAYFDHFPNYDFNNLKYEGAQSDFRENYKRNAQEWQDYLNNYAYFIYYNPNRSYIIDFISSGIGVEYRDGQFYGAADVDQGLKVIDVKTRTEYVISFCGPSCGFNEVWWIDNNKAIILGGAADNYNSNRTISIMILLDMETKTKYYFENTVNYATDYYKGSLMKQINFDY